MRAGELRDRVTLRRWTPTSDPGWGQQPGWADVEDFWASVSPFAANERSVQAGVQSVTSHRIVCRYRDNLTSKDRLVYRGRVLDIVGVHDPDGRKRELLIEAKENTEAV